MSEAPDKPGLAKPKRWVRFSLRAMLLATAIIAVWFGWIVNRAEKQKAAVAAIQVSKGLIQYDCHTNFFVRSPFSIKYLSPTESELDARLGSPRLRALIGEDYFQEVVSVVLFRDNYKEGVLETLHGLPSLKYVCLHRLPLSDAEIQSLAQIPRLETLILYDCEIADESLRHLSKARHLSKLGLSFTTITDANVDHLKKMPGLIRLNLTRGCISTEGLDELWKALPNCTIYEP